MYGISPSHQKVYKAVGGTPFLDMNYTVFGEVEKGLEVVDKIASVPTDQNNRPLQDVRMRVEIMPEPLIHPVKMKMKVKKK